MVKPAGREFTTAFYSQLTTNETNPQGFVVAAVANVYLTDRFGFGKVMLFGELSCGIQTLRLNNHRCPGSVLQVAAYAMLFPPGPFPLMCAGFSTIGFALALQSAHCNGYVAASKENVPAKIGYLHASYCASPQACPHRADADVRGWVQAVAPLSLRLLRRSYRNRAIGRTITSSQRDCTRSTPCCCGSSSVADGKMVRSFLS